MTKLTAKQVEVLTDAGRHSVGDGLYLEVDQNKNRRWIFRYQLDNKRRNKGLGAYDSKTNGLASARKKATAIKALIAQGIDPIDDERTRKAELKQTEQLEHRKSQLAKMTFEICARQWFQGKNQEWRNDKHRQQVINTLRDYVFPVFGDRPVANVELSDVRRCLDPIWHDKTETASRVRQRMEQVFSYAIANGYRTTANPAVWRGLLSAIYTNPATQIKRKHEEAGTDEHMAALPYPELPKFMFELQQKHGIAAVALKFTILTASRTYPVRMAKWSEIDFERRLWTVPSTNMKAKKEFRVALSDEALALLKGIPRLSDFIFPGSQGKPMSENTMLAVLKRMGYHKQVTVHGFRSTFRDYIGEETNYPERLAEHALAHVLKDATEAAYARGDKLNKRFEMMNDWARYALSAFDKNNEAVNEAS